MEVSEKHKTKSKILGLECKDCYWYYKKSKQTCKECKDFNMYSEY